MPILIFSRLMLPWKQRKREINLERKRIEEEKSRQEALAAKVTNTKKSDFTLCLIVCHLCIDVCQTTRTNEEEGITEEGSCLGIVIVGYASVDTLFCIIVLLSSSVRNKIGIIIRYKLLCTSKDEELSLEVKAILGGDMHKHAE